MQHIAVEGPIFRLICCMFATMTSLVLLVILAAYAVSMGSISRHSTLGAVKRVGEAIALVEIDGVFPLNIMPEIRALKQGCQG